MAKRPPTGQLRTADLTPEQMRDAIPMLKRRIADLRGINVSAIKDRGDPAVTKVEEKIHATILEIFGVDTVEYQRYRY